MDEKIPSEFMSIGDFLSELKESVLGKHFLELDEPADDIEDIFSDDGDQKDDAGRGFDSGEHTDQSEEPEEGDDGGDGDEGGGGGGGGSDHEYDEDWKAYDDDGLGKTQGPEASKLQGPEARGTEKEEAAKAESAKAAEKAASEKQADAPAPDSPALQPNKPDPLYSTTVAYDPTGVRGTIDEALQSGNDNPARMDQNPSNFTTQMNDKAPSAESIKDVASSNKAAEAEKRITVPIGDRGEVIVGSPAELQAQAIEIQDSSDDDAVVAAVESQAEEPNQEIIDSLLASSTESFLIADAINSALRDFFASRNPADQKDKDYKEDLERLVGNMEAMPSEFDMSVA
jgi:hypothetical protein